MCACQGWANWNYFGCDYNATTIRDTADQLVALGLRDVGYNTIIIQECITPAGHRDPKTGEPIPDPVKFPNGIDGLVDYIHSKGLKAGIYTDVGPETCAGYEGSYGHETIDAQTYAKWGLDFVEEDACHHNASMPPYSALYARMRDALNATGRPIEFYACVWGGDNVYEWGPKTANLWRTTGDILPRGGPGLGPPASWGNVMSNFRGNTLHPNATMPGAWQARRSSAEHLITTKVPRCTATAWILIVAQSSANPRQVESVQ